MYHVPAVVTTCKDVGLSDIEPAYTNENIRVLSETNGANTTRGNEFCSPLIVISSDN